MTRDLVDADLLRPDLSPVAVLGRRVAGRSPTDAWGLDGDLVGLLRRLPGLAAVVAVDGTSRVPDGPALLVHHGAPSAVARIVLATGVGSAVDRPVRWTGVPDVAPVVGVARRLGGVGGHPADLRGLLRAGELVAVPFAGDAPEALTGAVEAAVAAGAPVLPVAVAPPTPGRRAQLVVGEPIPTRRRDGARAPRELVAAVGAALEVPPEGGTATVPRPHR